MEARHGNPPQYAFSIADMRPKDGIVERTSHHGRWFPPKADGNNLSGETQHFYFNPANENGNFTFKLPGLPPNAVVHKTYSMYWERAITWIVNYDATKEKVGDGNESEQPEEPPERSGRLNASGFQSQSTDSSDVDSDDEEYKDGWAPLKFDHRDRDRLSYAGRRQPHSRLRIRRPDQLWARRILSDACSAQEVTTNTQYGGLIGELPLLIGLMAFAIPEDQLSHGICNAMSRPWRAPQYEREAGWRDKRGLVVTTYACEPHSTFADLVDYERGNRGIILP